MPSKLLFRDGQGMDASVDVPEATPIFLGRGADCAVRTDDAMVSRKNCKISFAGGKFSVEDLGSSNGTFLNERKIQKQQLTHGDVIRCGTLQVRYVEVAGAQRPRTAAVEAVQPQGASVGDAAAKSAEAERLKGELADAQRALKEASSELETLRARTESADNELKMLRAQAVSTREDMNKIKRDHAQDKEELHAVSRAAEELRVEVRKAREDLVGLKQKTEEQADEIAAKERQIERASEEVQRTKSTTEELRNKLSEVQKTKDEGWRELNSQLSQVDHLREVISEQERILEERRVGLIAIESAAKDLRSEKEKILRELVDVKNQRDDLRDKLNRAEAKVEGLEEEHRRLARVMSSGGVDASGGEEMVRLASDLREAKVNLKKLEQDKTRAVETQTRIEAERDKLLEERARLDVEKAQLTEDKRVAELARGRADEGRAKAESAKQRLDEEKQAAAAARDTALASVDELRRDLDRANKKLSELDKATSASTLSDSSHAEAQRKAEAARDEAVVARTRAETRVRMLEDELKKVQAQLATSSTTPSLASDGDEHTEPGGRSANDVAAAAAGGGDLRAKAQEVYDGINEALSELRTTILTAKGLFGEVSPMVKDEDARRALSDAIANSMDRTEDAKGLLRGLKELAQG